MSKYKEFLNPWEEPDEPDMYEDEYLDLADELSNTVVDIAHHPRVLKNDSYNEQWQRRAINILLDETHHIWYLPEYIMQRGVYAKPFKRICFVREHSITDHQELAHWLTLDRIALTAPGSGIENTTEVMERFSFLQSIAEVDKDIFPLVRVSEKGLDWQYGLLPQHFSAYYTPSGDDGPEYAVFHSKDPVTWFSVDEIAYWQRKLDAYKQVIGYDGAA